MKENKYSIEYSIEYAAEFFVTFIGSSPKTPVACQNMPGARYGKPGLPWTIACAITLIKISRTPVRMCSLLYTGISLPVRPVKSQRFAAS